MKSTPDENPAAATVPAFKEWQVICDALETGEQSVILRKGGIAEGRSGFSWQHEDFFLFPTRFHQQLDGVRGHRQLTAPAPGNRVAIRLWAKTLKTVRVTEWDRVTRLADHHIWSEGVIRERFEWGDEPGLNVALLRVHRLADPWWLDHADRPAFGGCRSWLQLPLAEMPGGTGLCERIETATTVIGDAEFNPRRSEIEALLDG